MKVKISAAPVNPEKSLVVGCDVSLATVEMYSEIEELGTLIRLQDRCPRTGKDLKARLVEFMEKAKDYGYETLLVACEPTGGYEKLLLKSAQLGGFGVAYVSGEAVSRFKVVESNDTGKTDPKDARIIFRLAKGGRGLKVRDLEGVYNALRRLSGFYEDEDRSVVQARVLLHQCLENLFPGWPLSNEFLFGTTGRALVELYGCNPRRIAKLKQEEFMEQVRSHLRRSRPGGLRGIRQESLQKVWKAAQGISGLGMKPKELEVVQNRLEMLYTDWTTHQQRKEELKSEMSTLFQSTPESKCLFGTGVSPFMLARLIAETGPLSDFVHFRQLWRYTGLNLRERTSGIYRGQTRISKKGRAQSRKVLFQIVRELVRNGRLYATRFRLKKKELANGMKALVAVMRHFLKMIHGLTRSKEGFRLERVFLSEAQLLRAA